eukprot:scaffold10546_cov266-Chaetoceros_neogracile.AAC.12
MYSKRIRHYGYLLRTFILADGKVGTYFPPPPVFWLAPRGNLLDRQQSNLKQYDDIGHHFHSSQLTAPQHSQETNETRDKSDDHATTYYTFNSACPVRQQCILHIVSVHI